MNQTYKATLSQHALPQFLPIWGGKGGVIWGDLEECILETMMFEKYPSISPYTYCSNNPINRIDPSGEDDYEVDRYTGEIKFLKQTNDATDRLVGQNWLGKVKTKKDGSYRKSIEVDKTVLQNREVDGKRQQMDFGGGENAKSQAIAIFNFLADNTDVEWGVIGHGSGDNNNNSIVTDGGPINLASATYLINSFQNQDVNYFYHNHPGMGGNEYPSQGLPGEGGNDLGMWNEIWAKNSNAIMGIRAGQVTHTYEYKPQSKKGYSSITRQ